MCVFPFCRVRDPGEGGERGPPQAARVGAPVGFPQLLGGRAETGQELRDHCDRQEPIRGERTLREDQDRHRSGR